MVLTPQINDILSIDNVAYRFTAHPAVPTLPYGQTGKRATVYQVAANGRFHALKIFIPLFRRPRTTEIADRLRSFAQLPGLTVCVRTVLTPQHHTALIHKYPNLEYAVLMPWVQGQTWQELHLSHELEFSHHQSRALAQSLVHTLVTMEKNQVAHCDLSGPNIMINLEGDTVTVELIDVEDLYAPQLPEPELKPGGSAGYAHRTAPKGLWSAVADRFAGAVLLAEILGWCDPRVRNAAYGEQYFDPKMHEEPQNNARLQVLLQVLHERWGSSYEQAFTRVWTSATLNDCPPMTEWAHLLGVLDYAPVVTKLEPTKTPSEAELTRKTPPDTRLEVPQTPNAPVQGWKDIEPSTGSQSLQDVNVPGSPKRRIWIVLLVLLVILVIFCWMASLPG